MLGAVAGSFTATMLLRWPAGRTVGGRSACDGCGRALGPLELVPILSFLLSRGRCGACGSRIARRHLAMEVGSALTGGAALWLQPNLAGLVTALLGWWLLLIAAIDLDHHWLPDKLTLPLLAAGLGDAAFGIGPMLADRLIGAAAGFVVLAAIRTGYRLWRGREGMGGGDPKLLAAIGAWLGWQSLPLVLVGAGLAGFAFILATHVRGGEVRMESRLPLGTLMAVAAWPIWLLAPV
jgi:leader peptidase (prepilin peptidase) / N-methyltransferase